MFIDKKKDKSGAPEERNIQREDVSAPLDRKPSLYLRFYKHFAPPERNPFDLLSTIFRRPVLAQLIAALTAAAALKYFYSTASVNELRWILAPTTWLVALISGQQFQFESYAGYINRDHTVVIAASCAGVNFLLTAFLMLSLRTVWRNRNRIVKWRYLGLAAIVAYSSTIIANTFRIATALQMLSMRIENSWLNANELHRLEGIFVYFGFLLLLYLLAEIVTDSPSNMFRLRRFGFPLAIYYLTTLGIPFINGAFRDGEFWQHAAFVLLTPMFVLMPLAAVAFITSRYRAIRFS